MQDLVILGAGKIGRMVCHLMATCGDYTVRVGDVAQAALDLVTRKHPEVQVQVVDFGAPLGRPVVYELANRFRLEHSDPGDPHSPVRNPIIFYVDRAAPEPIRAALREGVSWWAEAFAAAGWPGAFRAEILPEGADPLDLRYNVVNWVNRATRGWSYGQPIVDPRTVRAYCTHPERVMAVTITKIEALAAASCGNAARATPSARNAIRIAGKVSWMSATRIITASRRV